jgi:hypothetical protein
LLPTTNQFDFSTNINPPGATFDLAVSPGRTYFMGLRNPGASVVNFTLLITPDYADTNYNRFYGERVLDDVRDVSTTNSVIDVGDDKLVSDVFVGVQMRHPRSADLALTLITPQGSRILLAENRGGSNSAGFGSSTVVTNGTTISNQLNYVVFTDRTNLTQIPVKFANPGTSNALSGVSFSSGFEDSPAGNYPSGTTLADGWLVTPGGQMSIIDGPGLTPIHGHRRSSDHRPVRRAARAADGFLQHWCFRYDRSAFPSGLSGSALSFIFQPTRRYAVACIPVDRR